MNIRTQIPNKESEKLQIITDPDILAGYLEDSARTPGGWAKGLVRPDTEAQISAFLRNSLKQNHTVLPVGAQTSLTAGGTPFGDWILSTEKMNTIKKIEKKTGGGGTVVCEPGLPLLELQKEVRKHGLFYPPAPTYDLAFLGGTISTNASGSAAFKYGTTRDWVKRVRMVLASGEILEVIRGEHVFRSGQKVSIERPGGNTYEIILPNYSVPELRKISGGYFARLETDLIDLLIGSEGTLGVFSEIELELIDLPFSQVSGIAFFDSEEKAVSFAETVREISKKTWQEKDPYAIDIRAIEFMDNAALNLLVERGKNKELRVNIPSFAGTGIYFEMELSKEAINEETETLLEKVWEGMTPDVENNPLAKLFLLFREYNVLESLEFAFPEETETQERFRKFREAVPETVSEIIKENQNHYDHSISKVAFDLIVPFEKFRALLGICRQKLDEQKLDYAIWGHISDGNIHPNILAISEQQMIEARK
ncbi:MAG: FAD-binding oxidoreductase, partial [Candidatus Theseobacter exili]|nr:FAD-binding oxidoreductase [Candidatus Theseobacter exili]